MERELHQVIRQKITDALASAQALALATGHRVVVGRRASEEKA
jgi:hypothetical protein